MRSNTYTADQLGSLIDLVYEASLDAAQWPKFLLHLSDVLGGVLPTLFLHEARTGSGALTLNAGYDETVVNAYNDHFAERNIWLRSGAHLLRPGLVRTSHMMCSRKSFLASEWFADYCRPLDISQGIGATIQKDANVSSNIAIFAGDKRPNFGAEDIALLSALLPHLERALRIHTHLAESDSRTRELLETLTHLATGVILVTSDARVVFMNEAAQRLVSGRDCLRMDRVRIAAGTGRDTAALRRLIAEAAGNRMSSSGVLRIPRTHGRQPLEVTVSPIRRDDLPTNAKRAVAAIYAADSDRVAETAERAFARLHALTRAEERAAAAILRAGGNARCVADELGISYNTLKTQLKSVYAKTGTRGQADLIRTVLRGSHAPAGGGTRRRISRPRRSGVDPDL